ncbi:hypothetical protein BJX68DRAFT_225679 [Aspergillus pseudodeflectus]|uniref:Reverse transcriptase domain-containing protein n=1 Tax=Aspergillus pseudodeflectus TaxID=176178 RepID=A0ABR4L7S5_9EURO
MEGRLSTLRRYADDITELGLDESRAKIEERLTQLEAELEQQKWTKAEKPLKFLNRDFPDLAGVAIEEARRPGL